jgi:hypothetical protein
MSKLARQDGPCILGATTHRCTRLRDAHPCDQKVLAKMSPSSPPTPSSRAPAGVPSSGNGKYIAIVAVLLIGLGVIGYKLLGPKENGGPQRPIAMVDAAPTPHENPDDNVPPPPPIEEAGPPVVTKVTSTGSGDVCAARSCAGASTGDLESALAFRAKQAHRCYDMALAQDNTLQGHIKITVRVASNGQLCKADVASNDMGSAQVAQCVANMFRQSGHFPPPKGGCVDATVPIVFIPGGK